jgi:arsenate reductase
MEIKIWHNPRCSKSRLTLQLLKEKVGEENFEVIEYLKKRYKPEQLLEITKLLEIAPTDLIRKNESEYKQYVLEHGIPNDVQALELMVSTPRLIERPIVITPNGAKLGRPPENILSIL